MQLRTFITLLTALPFSCSAPFPKAAVKASTRLDGLDLNARTTFKLVTELKFGQKNKRFDGLYVAPLHTGAGFASAFVTSHEKGAPLFYFYGKKHDTFKVAAYFERYPKETMYLEFDYYRDYYEKWGPTLLGQANDATPGFTYTTKQGFKYLINKHKDYYYGGFGGWRVCEWALGRPQLFHDTNTDTYYRGPEPSSCALVNLKIVYTSNSGNNHSLDPRSTRL